jgi:signal transduction histidine kinase
MMVSDNGTGCDFNKIMNQKEVRKRSGLQNISARAKLINATVNIRSTQGEGTTIDIFTPIKNNQHGTTN